MKTPYNLGHFFIAIDITAFTELDEFKKTTGDILKQLRASKKAPGYDRIYTAGEKEHLAYIKRSTSGVPINEALEKDMLEIKRLLGVELPE
jgi:LDH2 family malate/lactate/ureidoglycolate dehydrogenase